MLPAIASAYFACALLAGCVSKSHHQSLTVVSIAYGLLTSLLVVYALVHLAGNRISAADGCWMVALHAGGIGFALLGEVPFLSNIVITRGWLHRLSPAAVFVTVLFATLIVVVGYRQTLESVRDHRCARKGAALGALVAAYGLVYVVILASGSAFHFHIHHAIFAGALALYMTDLKTLLDRVAHGILLGVVVEGICFYGSLEAQLYMVHDRALPPLAPLPAFVLSIVVAWIGYVVAQRRGAPKIPSWYDKCYFPSALM